MSRVKLTRAQMQALGLPVPKKERKGPKIDDQARRALFLAACRAHGIPEPTSEHWFSLPRKWRFDWAWLPQHLALEIQGGLFVQGRHSRGAALLKEHEKLNAAVCLGYRVLFCTPKDVETGAIFPIIAAALAVEYGKE